MYAQLLLQLPIAYYLLLPDTYYYHYRIPLPIAYYLLLPTATGYLLPTATGYLLPTCDVDGMWHPFANQKHVK